MTPSEACFDIIRRFEGFSAKPYLDTAGVPTIGYGTTVYPSGIRVTTKDPSVTQNQAEAYLEGHIRSVASLVSRLVKKTLSQSQFDAVVSLVYNIGIGNFSGSTMLRLLNAGNISGASAQFLVWNKAGGVVSRGLETRREAERQLFNS